jgi:catechol 2,3-dioxygenase-like lactoylglutathione lyase family enzyme
MYTSVNHTSFTVSDLDRSIAFYTDALGMKLLNVAERDPSFSAQVTGIPGAHLRIAYVEAAGFRIELIQYLSPPGQKLDTRTCNIGSAHVAFNVDDLQGMYDAMAAKDVTFISPPCTVPSGPNKGGKAVYLEDPDNNTLEFIEPPRP